MFAALRASKNSTVSSLRAFSTSRVAAADLAKLTLIGRLLRDPETRVTKNDKPFISYTVTTSSSNNIQGEWQRQYTNHRVLAFNPKDVDYLTKLRKGSKVYVEADYNIKEPEEGADPSSPQGQRHVFLTHDKIRVLFAPKTLEESPSEHINENENFDN